MPLPPKPFHRIAEIASRWQVDPIVIVGWAIEGRLALSAALPQIETADGRRIGGLLGVAGEDVVALFEGEPVVRVQRFRRDAKSEWEDIGTPAEGVPVRGASIVLSRKEVERFERSYGLFQSPVEEHAPTITQPSETSINLGGRPQLYDWDAFSGAMARHVHDCGMPESQGALVRDMSDWFMASYGVVPDESTLRRRIRAAWRELTRPD
jgi:hypothetical protein